MNEIKIEKAAPADAQTLAELGRSTFIETFAKDNTQEDIDLYVSQTFGAEKQLVEITDPKRFVELAWINDEAAGFFQLLKSTPDPCVTGEKSIEILRLYVEARWHGRGVGAALMERIVQLARENGFRTLWLGVWEKNVKAQAFYKKYRFQIVGQHIFRVGTDDQLDFVMACEI